MSEAYFARLIGCEFVAVMPARTSPEKIELIEREGGRCHLVEDATSVYAVAEALAAELDGHYIDQFTHAERATDWRGNNNIAESIFEQMAQERHPIPTWIVTGAGTGGTSATIGRYVRYRGHPTRPVRAGSRGLGVLRRLVRRRSPAHRPGIAHRGHRPAPGRAVVRRPGHRPHDRRARLRLDRHDARGRGDPRSPRRSLDRHQPVGRLRARRRAAAAGESGSIVTLLCDAGERYAHNYYDDAWVAAQGWDLEPDRALVRSFLTTGAWTA